MHAFSKVDATKQSSRPALEAKLRVDNLHYDLTEDDLEVSLCPDTSHTTKSD